MIEEVGLRMRRGLSRVSLVEATKLDGLKRGRPRSLAHGRTLYEGCDVSWRRLTIKLFLESDAAGLIKS
jgi:hypothetical protein